MADNIRLDSHKLLYHPKAVSKWLEGENIYPIELEAGLTNACNHRCIFCAVDYTGYKAKFINKEVLLKNLEEISKRGLKSVIYAGEGEPLLHKEAPEIINKTKYFGLDVAMSTNGAMLKPEVAKEILPCLTWVRFSTASIENNSYNKIHRCKEGDLDKVLFHMQEAVKLKRDKNLKVTIGVQLLLMEDNKDQLLDMAKLLKEIGVDYFTVKPFSKHPKMQSIVEVNYDEMLQLESGLKDFETDKFKVYFRANAMKKLKLKREYNTCYGLPFMVYLDVEGDLYPCIAFMGDKNYSYGNINNEDFIKIWEGEVRKSIIEKFTDKDLDSQCREICRLDEINRYLHSIVNHGEHINFI